MKYEFKFDDWNFGIQFNFKLEMDPLTKKNWDPNSYWIRRYWMSHNFTRVEGFPNVDIAPSDLCAKNR